MSDVPKVGWHAKKNVTPMVMVGFHIHRQDFRSARIVGAAIAALCLVAAAAVTERGGSQRDVSFHEQFLRRTADVRAQDPAFDCAWKQAACIP